MAITGHTLRDLIAEQGVEIIDKGHGVSRGNFNIKCPFCGAADGGHHMGINLDRGWWGCWRNVEHRGKSPVRLMVAILGKPVWEVRRILGLHSGPQLDTFRDVRERLERRAGAAPEDEVKRAASLEPYKEFRQFKPDAASERFWQYLHSRGFTGSTAQGIIDLFKLSYAIRGDYRDRVILPFSYQGAIVTWTGRSIHKDERLRYRDLEQEHSVLYKNEVLYNYDGAARGGRALIVLEGPFDVVKGEWAGARYGVHCVGLGTNNISDAQLVQLAELSDGFDATYIGMDTPTEFAKLDSYRMKQRIRGAVDARMLEGLSTLGKDVGGASIRQVSDLFRRVSDESLQ